MSWLEDLGLTLPVIQAPMAGAQDCALTIAVCGAGALGSLPCAMLDAAGIRREVEAIRAATARPFNLNFFAHPAPDDDASRDARWREALAPFYAEAGLDLAKVGRGPGRRAFDADGAALVEALRPPIVSFHFGLPEPALLARVRATGARILSSATTVAEARWLEERGVDAVIAQGLEAGGHRGHFLSPDLSRQAGLFALLPQVVAAVRVPVVAAGGIADAAGVRTVLALGAAAAQIGSAYLLCDEARISALHRAALAGPESAHTALTRLFTGRPARGIGNRAMREVADAAAPEFPLATAAIAPLRVAAEAAGRGDFSPLWCGQNASGCRTVPAAELTRGLVEG